VSSGTRLVLGFLLFAAVVFGVLRMYGGRSLSRRAPDSPLVAAREAVQADNTVVGLVGGIEAFEQVAVDTPSSGAGSRARLEARVLGARDSGRLIADLAVQDGRWTVRHATFTLSDGTTIPVAGSSGR